MHLKKYKSTLSNSNKMSLAISSICISMALAAQASASEKPSLSAAESRLLMENAQKVRQTCKNSPVQVVSSTTDATIKDPRIVRLRSVHYCNYEIELSAGADNSAVNANEESTQDNSKRGFPGNFGYDPIVIEPELPPIEFDFDDYLSDPVGDMVESCSEATLACEEEAMDIYLECMDSLVPDSDGCNATAENEYEVCMYVAAGPFGPCS